MRIYNSNAMHQRSGIFILTPTFRLTGTGAKDGLLVRWTGVFGRVLGLGGVVALTFAVLWAPFCAFPNTEEGEGCLSSMMQASEIAITPLVHEGCNVMLTTSNLIRCPYITVRLNTCRPLRECVSE